MNVFEVAKSAVRLTWHNKPLWLFGFFLAAGGGGGGAPGKGHLEGSGPEAVTAWLALWIACAVVAGIFVLILHVLSEGALISAVDKMRSGGTSSIGEGLAAGRRSFGRVLGVKLLVVLAMIPALAIVAAPIVLAVLKYCPLWLGIGASIGLILLALPLGLTLLFLYEYALRFAVLEERSALDAYRAAWSHLARRIEGSILLLLADGLGRAAASALGAVVIVGAGGLLAVIGWLIAGLMGAIAFGAVVAVPVAIALVAAMGTYRSTLWTLGFLDRAGAT